MITLESTVLVEGVEGRRLYDFLMNPNDADYRRWWPGTHLEYHTLDGRPARVGSRLFMDETIGRRRLRLIAEVVAAEPGRSIVWQVVQVVRLPAWVRFRLDPVGRDVRVTHTIEAGFRGRGAMLDGVLRLILSPTFADAMDAHVRTEFPRLGALIAMTSSTAPPT